MVPISVGRILVALDGSDQSKKALELAVDLAKMWNATIYLIHVQERLKMPKEFEKYAKVERIPPSNYFAMVCERNQFLGEGLTRVKEAGVKAADPICVQGDPTASILNAAKRNKIDLIIMGSRGLGLFKKAVVGSVCSKVFHNSSCTTIAVK